MNRLGTVPSPDYSRLHKKLQDVETGLYLEGSEYLYGLMMEEMGDLP